MKLTEKEIPVWLEAYSQAWAIHHGAMLASNTSANHADERIIRLRERLVGDEPEAESEDDLRSRVERAVLDIENELKTRHAACRGHDYMDALRLAAKWVSEAMKEPRHG